MDRCPVCGSALGDNAKACSICGTAFDEVPLKCMVCGTEAENGARECSKCGAEFVSTEDIDDNRGLTEENVETIGQPSEKEKGEAEDIAKSVFVDVELEELVKLPGIGPLRAKILFNAGYTDLRKLKQASVVELMNIRGIGRKAAGEIKSALREYSLEEIRSVQLTEDNIEAEHQCQLCGTVVSAYENSCYECGCLFNKEETASMDSDKLALSYYDSKLLRTPDNRDLWYARGATLVKMNEFEQAINSFNKSIEIDPSFQAAWMSKADVYNRLGEPAKAAECYSHIITKASGGQMPDTDGPYEDSETEEDAISLEPPTEEQPAAAEEKSAPPVPEITEVREPEQIKPHATDFNEIKMDFTKDNETKPDFSSMSEADLKKELSQRATFVKPYLALAKEIDVDINHAKRLISRAVTESKQGELTVAIQLMDEAIAYAEAEFKRKLTEDLENLAEIIRNLKTAGKDVHGAVGLLSKSKEFLEAGDIRNSADAMKNCLENVEIIAG
ncbi:MAG: tetratricopeptide repeat protein [Thermoplasmata archaeon]|nr:tetratricopeptide repeat protein [Thermoplasmata archaeon]